MSDINSFSPINALRQGCKCTEDTCYDEFTPCISDAEILDFSKSSQSNYFCVFSKIPNLIYYIQSFALPSATNRKIQIDLPHTTDYYVAGHKTDYDEITINFIMDENFRGYFSLLEWMRKNEKKNTFEETIGAMSLVILNNAKMPIIRVDFRDVLCSSLGDVQFNNQESGSIQYYATFTSYKYKVTYLNGSNIVVL